MSDLEQLSNLEHLNELSNDAIENMADIQPIENVQETIPETEKPNIEEISDVNENVSFSVTMCICSCALTCTRA